MIDQWWRAFHTPEHLLTPCDRIVLAWPVFGGLVAIVVACVAWELLAAHRERDKRRRRG